MAHDYSHAFDEDSVGWSPRDRHTSIKVISFDASRAAMSPAKEAHNPTQRKSGKMNGYIM